MRGSRTHGWGVSGQHRGKGMRGGHGKAGRCKHKWTFVVKYELEKIGKSGFKSSASKGKLSVMNVGELNQMIDELLAQGRAEEDSGKIRVDLTKLGCEKLLGEGVVSKPLVVKVKEFSKLAAKKIGEAGGEIVAPEKYV
jgi:large subunit ribosomal protein L15